MPALLHLKMDIDPTKLTAFTERFARGVATLPGLKFKIWGADHKKGEASGFYVYETRRDAEIRTRSAAEYLLSLDGITNVTAQIYDINEELSRITRAPLDVQANPSYPDVEDLDQYSDFALTSKY